MAIEIPQRWTLHRVSAWLAVAAAATVPIVSTVMWFCRRWSLERGLPCQARGVYDCGYDADLAAVYGGLVGLAFSVAAGAGYFLAGRFPRLGTALVGTSFVAWMIVAVVLIRATTT